MVTKGMAKKLKFLMGLDLKFFAANILLSVCSEFAKTLKLQNLQQCKQDLYTNFIRAQYKYKWKSKNSLALLYIYIYWKHKA